MRAPLVYLTVLAVATAGLVYELVAGTLASYVLGDTVTQFSTVIGVYLSAMGLGSYLSRFLTRDLARRFVDIELALALLGGISAPLLFLCFGRWTTWFRPVLYGEVAAIGTLVGLEIPLVLRILQSHVDFKDLVARVLSFDYLGALVASILFPLLLMPRLGLVRTSLLLGLLNGLVGLWSTWLFAGEIRRPLGLRIRAVAVLLLLAAGLAWAERLTEWGEEAVYADPVVLARSSPFQRIVLTQAGPHFQLFLNSSLQFSSADEYRYHEALVHPALALVPDARRALVLGGGDGLAVRELLRYAELAEIVLVDLDPVMTALARDNPLLAAQNEHALRSPRVRVVNQDAFLWLERGTDRFDVAIVDFPDPHSYSLGKLYSTRFYRMLGRRLQAGAVAAIQSTSPLFARRSYWCIARTLEAAGFHVLPYHALVPSFGEWGFLLAAARPIAPPATVRGGLRSLDAPTLAALFVLGPDLAPVEAEVNRLNNQVLVRYYDEEWRRWQ